MARGRFLAVVNYREPVITLADTVAHGGDTARGHQSGTAAEANVHDNPESAHRKSEVRLLC